MRWTAILALLLLTSASASFPCSTAEAGNVAPGESRLREAEQLFEQGKNASKHGEFRKAVSLYEQALSLREQALGKDSPELVPLTDSLGAAHHALRNYAEAARYYERSLAIDQHSLGPEHKDVATDLENLATLYERMGEYAKALPLYQRSLAIREKVLGAEHPDIARSLAKVAGTYWSMGEYRKALPFQQRNLATLEKRLGSHHLSVATSLNNLAELYRAVGDYPQALPLHRRSLQIREQALGAEHPDVGLTLNNLGLLYQEMGEPAKALPLLQRSLAIAEQSLGPGHPDVAVSLNNLALLYASAGAYEKALPLYQRSVAIWENVLGSEHPNVATNLSSQSAVYVSMGQYAKALALSQRALAIRKKALGPEHPDVASSYNTLGRLYRDTGDYAQALPLLKRSLAIREKAFGREHLAVAKSLNELSVLYQHMGEYAKALRLQERDLAISERVLGREHPDVATTLNNLAVLHQEMGDYPKAQLLLERSLAIRQMRLGGEHEHVANSLNNLAELYRAMGEYAKALPLSQRSLAIWERALGREHPDVAISAKNLANLYRSVGLYEKALPLYLRALRIASGAGAQETVWRAQSGLRRALAQEGQTELAIFFGKQAVNTVQGMRARLVDMERELQRSFVRNKEDVYRSLADLLIEQGHLPEAQQVLAMLKEEEFFDFVRRDAKSDPRTTRATLTAREEAWQKRYREVSERLGALGAEYEALRKKARLGLSEDERKRRAQLDADLSAARIAFNRFLAAVMKEAEQAGAERAREVGERGLATLRALQGTLGRLGEGVVVLHYVVGEERLRIIVTTPSVQIARSAEVKRGDLNRKIEQFRRALQDPKSDPRPLARELYGLLVAPVADDLRQAKAQTLMVSLDGALRYIPLAALHDGERYLVEGYRLAIFTEAAKDKLKDRPQDEWRLAGLGVTRAVEGFSPLPAVKQELEGIVKAGARGVLPGEVHLDEAFTAQRLRDALDRAYPVLHVASHFVFRPGTESNSFLLLGDGSRLTLREVREKNLDFRDVDLITLSACETAVGGGLDANGAEIEGFGALAQRQGARAVIATLWPVADESTGFFMQRFYRVRESTAATKAEALRQAQLAFIRGEAIAAASDASRGLKIAQTAEPAAPSGGRYAHPFFWAPFILMGNWL